MKKINLYIISLITIIICTTTACFNDDSMLDVNKIPGVVIDTTGNSQYDVFQFERLKIIPNLIDEDLVEEQLRYEWRINLAPNDTLYELISEDRNLDYEVRLKPTTSGTTHQIFYKVIDTGSGLEYIMAWPLTIKNNIGEGLVIANTIDGNSTDISHIMSAEVTPNFNKIEVKYNIYSAVNGGNTIDGLVKQFQYAKVGRDDALLGITDNSLIKINLLDYSLGGKNDDLFFSAKSNYQPQLLSDIPQSTVYVGNGKLTGSYLAAFQKFGIPYDFSYVVPNHLAINGFTYSPLPIRIQFYDEVNQHFVYQPSFNSFGDDDMHKTPGASGAAFDPLDVKNKINIAANVSTTGDFRHLLKDKSSGNLNLYIFDGGVEQPYPDPATPPAPKASYSLSNAPEINNATKFVLLQDQRVLYYATNTKIYAMLYSTSIPSFELRYTVEAGEEITTMQIYKQAGFPYDGTGRTYLNTNNKQLIISTFEGTEGKVSLLPIINSGLANIDTPNIKTFEGFGRITAIGTQK